MTYTTAEVAKRWGVSPNKVQAWIRNGDLAAYDISANDRPRYRISERAIQAFETCRSVTLEKALAHH